MISGGWFFGVLCKIVISFDGKPPAEDGNGSQKPILSDVDGDEIARLSGAFLNRRADLRGLIKRHHIRPLRNDGDILVALNLKGGA